MPLDQQARRVLDQLAALGLPPNHTVSPQQARINMNSRPQSAGPEVARVEDRAIPGPGPDVPVRIYTPDGRGPFPVLVWFHGGGWVVGDLDTADGTARRLTAQTGCVVVSVDYRLAPEARFPAAAEDCYAVTQWVATNAAGIDADPGRIAVGGDSSGGNLAAVVSLMARDRGVSPPVFQLLVYPVIARDFDTGSYRQNGEGYGITRDSMKWYWDLYLTEDADASNPYAAPLLANDLSGLPPALVITAEFDPLCDEGEAYAQRLQEAGVAVTYSRYDGMIHGFFGMPAFIDRGRIAVGEASAALKAAFSEKARAASP
ncbi:MAG: alpha/beta hydrolase [Dehalococcoidia bacterium]|jgi:acetyl esterase|nr:alpha/beta hydrolase [Dehalococcoidia bacterium]MDP6227562.1 alpha/beta hydrolase [Dehalococcoidia bacterium]MDP7085680.1 alpha/beta hydrolase [Dehalococcoidia bacterium]MDP7510261.1 alpha/beta hydrolase [Dehalococcoidia bacterium]HJN88567.1 alpha/beta hydrolase [Dehalococcoidia bacterium]